MIKPQNPDFIEFENDEISDYILCPTAERKDFAREIRLHKKNSARKFNQIKKSKSSKQLKNRIHQCFNSYSVRFTYVLALLTERQQITKHTRIEELANQTGHFTALNETVEIYTKKKPGGDFRVISKAGFKTRVLQDIAANILKTINCGYCRDFSLTGKGRERATAHIKHLIEKMGIKYFVVGDFRNFFGFVKHSFVRELLAEFPGSIIKHVLLNESAKLHLSGKYHSDHKSEVMKTARLGIPQGSPASPRIASALHRSIFEGIAPKENIVVYVDDFVIGVSSESEAEEIKQTLQNRLCSHKAGPFELKLLDVKSVTKKFDFLNYRFKYYKWMSEPKNLAISPNTTAWNNLAEKVNKVMSVSSDQTYELQAWLTAKRWLEGHSSWKYTEAGLMDVVIRVKELVAEEFYRRGEKGKVHCFETSYCTEEVL